MTQSQAIRLVCRSISLYLLLWAVGDLTALPREFLTVYEAWSFPALSPRGTFYLREQILFLSANVLRIGIWLALALWFYQVSPRIQRWFGIKEDVRSAENQTTE